MNENLQRFMNDCKAFFAEGIYIPIKGQFFRYDEKGQLDGCCVSAFPCVQDGTVAGAVSKPVAKYKIEQKDMWEIIYGYDGDWSHGKELTESEYYKAGEQLRKELNPR